MSGEEGAQQAPANSQAFSGADLGDGKTLSLVAVTKNGASAQEGWQPNGREVIDIAKWPPGVVLFCGDQAAKEAPPGVPVEDDARDLLFEFKGLRGVPSMVVQTPGHFGVFAPEPLQQPYRLRVATRVRHEPYVVGAAYEPTAMTFRIGFTDEPWGTWLLVGPDGKSINRIDLDDPEVGSYALTEVRRIAGNDSEPVLVLRQPLSKIMDLQVRCFDSFGNEYHVIERPGRRVGTLDVKESEFATSQPLAKGSRLARFEYRVRKYRHWVTFENVSLHAGKVTDVKCRIDTPPRDKSGIDVEAGANGGSTVGDASAATTSQNKQAQPEVHDRSGDELRWSEPTEIVLAMGSLKFMLDLDTGRTMDPPMTKRAEQQQMDIHPNQVQPYHYPTALKGIELEGVEVKASDWNASAAEVRRALAGKGVGQLKEMDVGPEKTPTYFFKTRAATKGILQLVEITHEPKGIRLRYKIVTATEKTDPAADPPDENRK